MKKIILSLIAVLAFAFAANANTYTIDDEAIDTLIENCADITYASAGNLMGEAPAAVPTTVISSANPAAAVILCFFLGGFGIHRHYLGTGRFMWAAYTFTFGGIFGILPLVDFVVLVVGLVDDNISEYCNNKKFIMWA